MCEDAKVFGTDKQQAVLKLLCPFFAMDELAIRCQVNFLFYPPCRERETHTHTHTHTDRQRQRAPGTSSSSCSEPLCWNAKCEMVFHGISAKKAFFWKGGFTFCWDGVSFSRRKKTTPFEMYHLEHEYVVPHTNCCSLWDVAAHRQLPAASFHSNVITWKLTDENCKKLL